MLPRLLADALSQELGSAIAMSVGDGGKEVERLWMGTTQRVPAPGTAITANTRFDVASLTKPMVTAALAMTLVSQGRLSLDATATQYLGAAASPATVRQLLGHAGGCAAHAELFRALWSGQWAGAATAKQALVQGAMAQPLAYAPGSRSLYSDLGYIQLGALLELAGGAPLDALFACELAEPLGLTSARFVNLLAEAPIADDVVATEFDATRGLARGVVHDENCHAGGGVAGHAGLFASIADLATFAAAMLRLGRGQSLGKLDGNVARHFFSTAASEGASWRLGWDTPSAEPGVSHAGDLWPRLHSAGHLGFTGTSIWLDFARQRWLVLLTNRVHPTRDGTADAIRALRRSVADATVRALEGGKN
jgi:CubicO group peptidase (beta-lactamase class C family)